MPSIQEDVRKGTKVDRKQQQQRQGLTLYTRSFNTIQQSTLPLRGPRLWWM